MTSRRAELVMAVTRRVLGLVCTLLVASILLFAALHVAPGSPAHVLGGGRPMSPSAVDALTRRFHLDDPLPIRYLRWVADVARGDLGRSVVYDSEVSGLVGRRLALTLELSGLAAALVLVFGLGLGVVAALRGGRTDRALLVATSVGQAIPAFVASMVLTWVFAVRLGWFPSGGVGGGIRGRLHHLVLPASALAFTYGAWVARMGRAVVRDAMTGGHVETAIARGLPRWWVIRHHVLHNATVPLAATTAASLAGLFASTVVVERAFDLDGLGSLLAESVARKDFATVQAVTLLMVLVFVVCNGAVDLLRSVVDLRHRPGGTT